MNKIATRIKITELGQSPIPTKDFSKFMDDLGSKLSGMKISPELNDIIKDEVRTYFNRHVDFGNIDQEFAESLSKYISGSTTFK